MLKSQWWQNQSQQCDRIGTFPLPKRLQNAPMKALALRQALIPMLAGKSRFPLLIGFLCPIIGLLSLLLAVLARI